MDSFYDAPRRPPQPIPRETFPGTPVVPEISVLCPSNTPRNPFTSYNQWKKNVSPNNVLILNKENIDSQFQTRFQSSQNTSILKKQVRFESPVLQQRSLDANTPFLNKTEQNLDKIQAESDASHMPHDKGQAVPSFEEMYMANIPNRQLDLSVIETPKRMSQNKHKNQCSVGNLVHDDQPREKEQPKTYRQFLESQKMENKVTLNDSVTDIFNYKRNLSPKVTYDTNKIGIEGDKNDQYRPILGLNVCQQVPKDLLHKQNENNGKKEPAEPGQHFQHVTQAISQRNLLMPHENAYNQGLEPKPWFLAQNTDYGMDLQNKVRHENNINQVKTSPQETYSIPKHNDLLQKNSPDTRSKHDIETIRFKVATKNNNFDISRSQADNRSHTVPSVLCSENPNSCETANNAADFKHECYTQTSNEVSIFENNAIKRRCDDDFSVKDLLKIIAQQSQQISQQNEQLLLLQKQVSTLICQRESDCPRQKSIQCGQERICCQQDKNNYGGQKQYCEQMQSSVPGFINENLKNIQDRCITSTQHETSDRTRKNLEGLTKKNKNNMPNFSIGLTTSFEVSFRGHHYNKKNQQLPAFDQQEPLKIQDITESDVPQRQENYQNGFQKKLDNRETLVDESMTFKEPIRVREPCPSPEPSIKINMNDFEDSDSEEDLTYPEIGSSFYRNLMVQVNKILKKAEIETSEEVAYNFKGRQLKHNTLHEVKEATLKHLRRIGVEVQNSEDSSQSSSSSDGLDSKSYNPEDISFAVKQLLMKYLPADHLAKAAYKQEQPDNHALTTPKGKTGAIKSRPDFSFATVQYMKKYNLIANNQKDFHQAKQHQPESPKVLDLTKLKQQPKLL